MKKRDTPDGPCSCVNENKSVCDARSMLVLLLLRAYDSQSEDNYGTIRRFIPDDHEDHSYV